MTRPLAIELFCGSFGWSAGWVEQGGRAVGFDLEHLPHHRPIPDHCEVVIQDVLTLHGSQFKDAAIILASPPCTQYSYLAMPWSRSKDIVRPCGDGWEILNSAAAKEMLQEWIHEGPDNRLFDACFRIQREAIEATIKTCLPCWGTGGRIVRGDCKECNGSGYTQRYIPLIVENVRGAQPWVGRSVWNYGSFHLWGDVPALMPITLKHGRKVPGFRFDGSGGSFQTASVEWLKRNPDGTDHPQAMADSSQGDRRNDNSRNDGGDEQSGSAVCSDGLGNEQQGAQADGGVLVGVGTKGRAGGGWFGDGKNGETRKSDPRDVRKQADGSWMTPDGTKIGGDWFSDPNSTCHKHGSRSSARKAASAQIAKIPFDLASYIARVYYPRTLDQGLRPQAAEGKS